MNKAVELDGLPDSGAERRTGLVCLQIGACQVEPDLGRISGPDGATLLEPKAMAVLVYLARRPGKVVSANELIDAVWVGRPMGDSPVYRCIALLRRALGDDSRAPTYIATVPTKGYRLIAPVRPAAEATTSAASLGNDPGALDGGDPDVGENTAPPADSFTPSRRMLLGAALAVAAGGLGLWFAGRRPVGARVEDLIEQSAQALRNGLPSGDAQAVGFLEEAVAIEPADARAWGKLALARCHVVQEALPEQVAEVAAGVQDAARRALALDRQQVDAHAALALLPPYFGDWLAAERRMRAVLAIDPEHLPTRDALVSLLVAVGRAEEGARDRLAFAVREPLHAAHQYRLVYALWILGQIGAADRAVDRALHLWPKHPGVWFARLWTLAFTGRPERALDHLGNAAARPELPPWLLDTLRLALTALESRRAADIGTAVERVLADLSHGPGMSISAIMMLTALGEVDHAFDVAHAYLLERGPVMAAVRWRPGQLSINDQRRRKSHVLFTPATAPLRADARFLPLVRETGLTDYWREVGVTPEFMR
jgi:DNA-binding winged helix-turn-helix (wHTH) protein